jgi:hypothetical protein
MIVRKNEVRSEDQRLADGILVLSEKIAQGLLTRW